MLLIKLVFNRDTSVAEGTLNAVVSEGKAAIVDTTGPKEFILALGQVSSRRK